MGSTGAATLIQAVYLVVSIITTVLVGPLDKALGRKRTMLFGAIVLVLGKVWFILNPDVYKRQAYRYDIKLGPAFQQNAPAPARPGPGRATPGHAPPVSRIPG